MTLFSVKDGQLVVPCGMTYRVLVLPDVETMTPALLRKIKDLVAAGATVIGRPPVRSPSLTNYPACDSEIAAMAKELWGDCDGKTMTEHGYGKGHIIWGRTPEDVLAGMNVKPDFAYVDSKSGPNLLYTHRIIGGTDAYFVANKRDISVEGVCRFRTHGKSPEFWWPQTGRMERVAAYEEKDGVTRVPIHLDSTESVFVIFRGMTAIDPVTSVTLDGQPILPSTSKRPVIIVQKASYGIAGDLAGTRDVRSQVQAIIDGGGSRFEVADLDKESGHSPDIVKTLTMDYTVNGRLHTATGNNSPTDGFWNAELRFQNYRANTDDSDEIELEPDATPAVRAADVRVQPNGALSLEARQNGSYVVRTAAGKSMKTKVSGIPAPVEISGPWDLQFPPNWGAPARVTLDRLISWTGHSNAGVKYFSGTATYRKSFSVTRQMLRPGHRLYLDLGDVQVIAEVKLNGKDLGILWKPPYSAEVTGVVIPGDNALEVKVTNLWPNRMIGDEQLPEDSDRAIGSFLKDGSPADGTLRRWPQWLLDGKPSPTGRLTFTSWRLWGKNDPLLPSGLLGPVTLCSTVQRALR